VAEDGNKMAWGGADRIVSVWDPRETTSKACLKLKSHEVCRSFTGASVNVSMTFDARESLMKTFLDSRHT